MSAAAVIPFSGRPPDRGKLEKLIHELAMDGAFSFQSQAFDKCLDDGIDIHDVLQVIAHGALRGRIDPGVVDGEWRCKMVSKIGSPQRLLSVTTIVIGDVHLFLASAEWEEI